MTEHGPPRVPLRGAQPAGPRHAPRDRRRRRRPVRGARLLGHHHRLRRRAAGSGARPSSTPSAARARCSSWPGTGPWSATTSRSPMEQRPAVQAMLAESDPQRLVADVGAHDQLTSTSRSGRPRPGAAGGARRRPGRRRALDELSARRASSAPRAFVRHLHGVGGLRPGLDPEQAADICWTLVNSPVYERLVHDRDWSRAAYEEWLVTVVSASLLGPVADHGDPDLVTPGHARRRRAVLPASSTARRRHGVVEKGERFCSHPHRLRRALRGLRVGFALLGFALDDLAARRGAGGRALPVRPRLGCTAPRSTRRCCPSCRRRRRRTDSERPLLQARPGLTTAGTARP